MINLDLLKNIDRVDYQDSRTENCYRCDRNEKIVDWPKEYFNKILDKTTQTELTSYPKDNFRDLHEKFSNYLGVNKSNINITTGSDAAIRDFFILNHHIKKIAVLSDTYGMYSVYAKCFGIEIIEIPYEFDLNSNGNIAFLRKDKLYQNIKDVDAFCFVNPNQISNNDISLNELDSLCKNYPDKKFLIDEAYYGFGHYTAIPLTRKHNNIFVTRSFSKTFGLASLRVGALVASEDSIKPFKTLATTYASNVFSSQSCIFFLDNINCVRYYNDLTVLGRDWFVNELRKSEYKVVSPKSISIMIYCDSQKEQQRILQESKEKEFYFKGITTNSKHHFIRVTCGPEKIMQQIYKKCFKND